MKIFLGLLITLCFVGLSTSKFTCQDCVTFWNNLRRNVGCNNQTNSVCLLVEQIFFVSSTVCQKSIDAICGKGCESDPARCAYVACGLLKFCNGTKNEREFLGIDNYHRTVSKQFAKINSRDTLNEFKDEKKPETDDDFEESEVKTQEAQVSEGNAGSTTTQVNAQQQAEQQADEKPERVILVVVHEEFHDVVYVEIPLMEHLKMTLKRAAQRICAFFGRIHARFFPNYHHRHEQSIGEGHEHHIPKPQDSHGSDPMHVEHHQQQHHVDHQQEIALDPHHQGHMEEMHAHHQQVDHHKQMQGHHFEHESHQGEKEEMHARNHLIDPNPQNGNHEHMKQMFVQSSTHLGKAEEKNVAH